MIFKENSYTDVVKEIYPKSCKFECEHDSNFIESLVEHGHTEILKLWNKDDTRFFNSDIPYSYCTGYMYFEDVDSYYRIELCKEGGTLKVFVEYCPELIEQDFHGAEHIGKRFSA